MAAPAHRLPQGPVESELESWPLAMIHHRSVSLRRKVQGLPAETPRWRAASETLLGLDQELMRRKARYGWWNADAERLRSTVHSSGHLLEREDLRFRLRCLDRPGVSADLESRIWTLTMLRAEMGRASGNASPERHLRLRDELNLRLQVMEELRHLGRLDGYLRRLDAHAGPYRPEVSYVFRRSAAPPLVRRNLPRVLVPSRTDALARQAFIGHRRNRMAGLAADLGPESAAPELLQLARELLGAALGPLGRRGRRGAEQTLVVLRREIDRCERFQKAEATDYYLRHRQALARSNLLDLTGGSPEVKSLARAQGAAAEAAAWALVAGAIPGRDPRRDALRRLTEMAEPLIQAPDVLELALDVFPHLQPTLELARAVTADPALETTLGEPHTHGSN